jgi:hypothetical protein
MRILGIASRGERQSVRRSQKTTLIFFDFKAGWRFGTSIATKGFQRFA